MAFDFNKNPWSGFFDENPMALYRGMLERNKSQNFMDYFRSNYGNTWDNYQGALGQQILGGGAPTLSFYDYLLQNPFQKEWQSLSPSARGQMRNQAGRWNIRW